MSQFNVSGQSVTVSWNDVANETSYNIYLVQAPWAWGDIKYSKTVSANTTTCTFTGVAYGDYAAFVISMPNGAEVQSKWTHFSVIKPCTVTLNANGGSVSTSSVQATYGAKYPSLPTPTNRPS